MRISNPAISQYLSNSVSPNSSVNQSQTVDRFPVKAVSIEDQPAAPVTTIPQVIAKPTTENFSDSLLIQSKLSDSLVTSLQHSLVTSLQNSLAASSQPESATLQQNFPYANRRSFEGLAGSSLVIQKYLNNESPAPAQSEGFQRNIDFFI